MKEAVIVATQRTPVGKFKMSLSGFTAAQLSAMAMRKCVEKAGIKPDIIDEVILGNLYNYDFGNLARYALLEAGFPFHVPGISLSRQCSSSLNAAAYAALLVQTGNAEVVLAGGVESCSQKPIMIQNPPQAFPSNLNVLTYASSPPELKGSNMIQTAENLAEKYHLTREECDEFALLSHQKAARAWNENIFEEQVFPVMIPQRKGAPVEFKVDECVRFDASIESLAKLRPVMGGVVTPGNASPMNDGAAMVLVMSAEKAREYKLEPLARISASAAAGVDPAIMGIGPVDATRKLLKNTGLTVDDIDLFELNEAFAAQSIPCIRELKLPMEKVNVNGGAIAIGHPTAASGGILIGRMAHEMKRRNAKRGIVTFCCGGGQGFSVLFER